MQELDLEDGRHVWVILAQSREVASHEERSGVIRVKDYLQTMAITTDGKGGTKGKDTGCSVRYICIYIYMH